MAEQKRYNVYIDGHPFAHQQPISVIPGIVFSSMEDIRIAPLGAIKDRIEVLIALIEEVAETEGSRTRVLNNLRNLLSIPTWEMMVERIYDIILSSEGHGRLFGYGYSICENEGGSRRTKVHFAQSAERTSVRAIDQRKG